MFGFLKYSMTTLAFFMSFMVLNRLVPTGGQYLVPWDALELLTALAYVMLHFSNGRLLPLAWLLWHL